MPAVRVKTNDATMTDVAKDLIAHGRDREAVAFALGGTMNGLQLLDEVGPTLMAVVGNISEADLGRPTPCAKFDVAGVLEHMVGGASAFAPLIRGEAEPGVPPTEGSVIERWNTAMENLIGAVHSAGSQERTIASPFGDVTGATFTTYLAFDGITHAWDIAVATGQTISPSDEVVAGIEAFVRDFLKPEMRDGDTFAEATEPPASATPLERLVAFSGRSVPS